MTQSRIANQIDFILEIDKLKSIIRRTYLLNGARHENSAEHSWQVAAMAAILVEHATVQIDVDRVIKMLLLHDIVEIDSGDVFVYDTIGMADKPMKEATAAKRIFGLLPADQACEYTALWDEFEARGSSDAKFAAALDRLMPVLHNIHSQKSAWDEHGVTLEQVLERNRHIADGSEPLWEFAEKLIRKAFADTAVERA